jgi:OmpA-OmpF porin, OOP family
MKRLFTTLLISIAWMSFAQYEGTFVGLGDEAFGYKDYPKAADLYLMALGEKTTASEQNFPYASQIGMHIELDSASEIYVRTQLAHSYRLYFDYKNAETRYKDVVEMEKYANPTTVYWYGISLRAVEKFEEAINQFNKVKTSGAGAELKKDADFQIKCCEFAIETMEHPEFVKIEKAGKGRVNMEGTSSYAVSMVKGEDFYYTTTKHLNKKQNKYTHSIATSNTSAEGENDILKEAKNKRNFAAASVSQLKNRIYYNSWSVLDDEDIKMYMRPFDSNGVLGEEKELSSLFVAGKRTLYPSVTNDGLGLYFASDRDGGFGGMDIWFVALDAEGMPMGTPINLGSTINTDKDESTPAFDQNQLSLYFSSTGHVGLGGFDIFRSKRAGSSWEAPVNMGYPINGPNDDQYHIASNDTSVFYLSSDRTKECCLEVFKYTRMYLFTEGYVNEKGTSTGMDSAKVVLMDADTKEILGTTYTDKTGKYSFPLDLNRNYEIVAEKEHFGQARESFSSEPMYEETTTIKQPTLYLSLVGRSFVLNNIYYDYDKATLRPESKEELDRLVALLNRYPSMKIEISAHTDSKGSDAYNQKLSERRAMSVVEYLIGKGISDSRFTWLGYGEKKPIAPNTHPDGKDNPEGRQQNRRTEFKVLDQ